MGAPMKISKLFNEDGTHCKDPLPFDGTVYWDTNEAKAQAFGPDGRELLSEMQNARVVRITHQGFQIDGFEATTPSKTQFRPMAWFVTY